MATAVSASEAPSPAPSSEVLPSHDVSSGAGGGAGAAAATASTGAEECVWLPWATIFPADEGEPAASDRLGVRYLEAQPEETRVVLRAATGSDAGAFLRIKQSMDDKDGLGAVVWHCGRVMAWYLAWATARGTLDLAQTNVLDLGSGTGTARRPLLAQVFAAVKQLTSMVGSTGVAGIAALLCGPNKVALTDLKPALSMLQHNVGLNTTASLASRVEVHEYNWESDTGAFSGRFHLVLCSDCLYDEAGAKLLCATLADLGAAGTPSGAPLQCIMTYKKRYINELEHFETLAASGFRITVLGQEALPKQWQHRGLYVVKLIQQPPKVGVEATAETEPPSTGKPGDGIAAEQET